MSRPTRLAAAALALLVAAPTIAPALAQAPPIMVQRAWARATAPGQKIGGVFLTLLDTGEADRLLFASTPAGDSVELHETTNDAGVMRMRPVDGLALPRGQSVELKPGGYHLMVIGLKQPLTPGRSFPITLTFENARPVTAMVTVGSAGASGPEMSGGAMPMGAPAMHTKP